MNFFANSDLTVIVIFLIMFSLIISLLMVILRQSQRHNKELIGTMRDSYEKQIYMMTDRLTASMDRWRDVNHLVIGSQATQPSFESSKSVRLSAFLKANGIQQDEIEPEHDLVFVLAPFNNRFEDVFDVIRNTCQRVGLRCMRGDEEFIQGDILPHILKLMCKAAIVIANIDGRNANVFYELGLAHAMDKSTLLVSKTVEDLPVDVKSKKIIVYKHLNELGSLLKDELLRLAFIKSKASSLSGIGVTQGTSNQGVEDQIRGAMLGSEFRLFYNPKVPGLSKTKIMRFGLNGEIIEGKNQNENTWRIRGERLELVDSEGLVHSRFTYYPEEGRFSQENDPDSGSMRKHGIQGQYMIKQL